MHRNLLLLAILGLTGCGTTSSKIAAPRATEFPADAVLTQRATLTALGKQVTLNGYLATSASQGQRLVITENFGNVLADVIVKPDGSAHVMKSSRAFKPKWISRYIAADVRCLFGRPQNEDCPVQWLDSNRCQINRRWYRLDLQIVAVKPGAQPAALFDPTGAAKP